MKYKRNLAKYLRKNQTYGEKLLWKYLRNKNLEGLKFRRQHPINNYVVDFYCKEKSLIIEIDGPLHDDEGKKSKDFKRQTYLLEKGYNMLRFKDTEISDNIEKVIKIIEKTLRE